MNIHEIQAIHWIHVYMSLEHTEEEFTVLTGNFTTVTHPQINYSYTYSCTLDQLNYGFRYVITHSTTAIS